MIAVRLLALCALLLASTVTAGGSACAGDAEPERSGHAMHAASHEGEAHAIDSAPDRHTNEHEDCGTDCCEDACVCASTCPTGVVVLPADNGLTAVTTNVTHAFGGTSTVGQPPGLDVPPPRSA